MRIARLRLVPLLLALGLAACAETGEPQTISGTVALTGFSSPVIGVRAVQNGDVVALASVAADGRFTLEVPAGEGYGIEVVTRRGTHPLILRGDRPQTLAFDVCEGNRDPFEMGDVHHWGDEDGQPHDSGGNSGSGGDPTDPDCGEPTDPDPMCPNPGPDGQCDWGDPPPPCDPMGDPNCDPTDPPPPCDPNGDPNCDPTDPPPPCDPMGDPNCDPGVPGDPTDPPCGPNDPMCWPCEDPNNDGTCDPPCDPMTDPNCGPGTPTDPGTPGDPTVPCDPNDPMSCDPCLSDPNGCWPDDPVCPYSDPACWPDPGEPCDPMDPNGNSDPNGPCYADGAVPENPLPSFGCEE